MCQKIIFVFFPLTASSLPTIPWPISFAAAQTHMRQNIVFKVKTHRTPLTPLSHPESEAS